MTIPEVNILFEINSAGAGVMAGESTSDTLTLSEAMAIKGAWGHGRR